MMAVGICSLAFAMGVGAAEPLHLTPSEQEWIKQHPIVRIQMSDVSPPFEFKERDEFKGLAYEILLLAATRAGLKVQTTGLGWSESLEKIQQEPHGVDLLLCVTQSPEREQQMLLTHSYLSFPQVIFTTKQHTFVSGLKDLRHSTIVVENEYVMESWLKRDLPEATFVIVNDTIPALQAVAEGRADAYVGNLGTASYLIEKLGLVNLEVAAPSGYGNEDFAMGIRKDWPELVSILNKGLNSITPEEEQALRQQWIVVRYEHGWRTLDLLKWIVIVVVVALIFIIQLRRMVKQRTRALDKEIELRREKEFHLSEAQRIGNVGSWTRDIRTNEIVWSEEALRIFGIPPGHALTYEEFFSRIHPEDLPGVRKMQAQALREHAPVEAEYRVLGYDGETRNMLARWIAMRDSAGQVVKIEGAVMDITARKRMEEHLKQSQKVESIGRLAGGVAHDFNNLLTSILGFAELARIQAKDQPAVVQSLSRIVEAANRGSTLTQQLLAYARKKIVRPEVIDINKSLERMVPMLRRLIGEDIELVISAEAQTALVLVDPGGLEQVIMNLAVNARDAMPSGGKITISTSNAREPLSTSAVALPEPVVVLSVADIGVGMEPETLERIFEPFFTTKPVGKGTGLGLAMCLGIVTQAGGTIDVQSEPGKGATFRIRLPQVPEPEKNAFKEPAIEPKGGTETLLIVEDDSLVRELACASLQMLGYDILSAGDGVEGLRVAQEAQRPIHMLITDVVMPRMGGRELASQIAIACPGIRILYASGYTEHAIVDHGVLEKGIHFIQKPYTPISLALAVRSILDNPKDAPA